MIGPEHEAAQAGTPGAAGFGDAVTFAFGDPGAGPLRQRAARARPGRAAARERPRPAVRRRRASPRSTPSAAIEVRARRLEPRSPSATCAARSSSRCAPGRSPSTARRAASSCASRRSDAPAELGGGALAASAAGLHGLRAALPRDRQRPPRRASARASTASASAATSGARPTGSGSRSRARVSAWFEDGAGVALASVRPQGAAGHDDELACAFLFEPDAAIAIADPRLSTTLDAEGRQRRAGLELWVSEDDEAGPHRARGRGRLRHDARPRAAAARLRVLPLADGRAARASAATTSCGAHEPDRGDRLATSAAC